MVEYLLQHEDIRPRTMIGNNKIPSAGIQTIQSLDVPFDFFREPDIERIDINPEYSDQNQYLRTVPLPCFIGDDFEQCQDKDDRSDDETVDEVEAERY